MISLNKLIKFTLLLTSLIIASVILLYLYIHFPKSKNVDPIKKSDQSSYILGDSPETHPEYLIDIPCYKLSKFFSLNFYACKNLLFQRIHAIIIHDTVIENHSVALYKISYGEPNDCLAGCFFNKKIGVLIDGDVYDLEITNYEEIDSKKPTHPFMRNPSFKNYIKKIDQYSYEILELVLEKSKN